MKRSNYYDVLGISPNASAEEIRLAYLKLAKRWHPDRNLENRSEAEEKFKEISQAYATLSVPEQRVKYDAELKTNSSNQEQTMGSEAADEVFFYALLNLALGLAEAGATHDDIVDTLMDAGCPRYMSEDLAQLAFTITRKRRATPNSSRPNASEMNRDNEVKEEDKRHRADRSGQLPITGQSIKENIPQIITVIAVILLVIFSSKQNPFRQIYKDSISQNQKAQNAYNPSDSNKNSIGTNGQEITASEISGENNNTGTDEAYVPAAINPELVNFITSKIQQNYEKSGIAGLSDATKTCYDNSKFGKIDDINACILIDRVSYIMDRSFRKFFLSQYNQDPGPTVPYFSDDQYSARRTLTAVSRFRGSTGAEDAFFAEAVSAALELASKPDAAEGWTYVTKDKENVDYYYNRKSIQRAKNIVTVWERRDHSKDKTVKYREGKTLVRYDCDENKYTVLNFHEYYPGEQVNSFYVPTNQQQEMLIVPDTLGETMMKAACGSQ